MKTLHNKLTAAFVVLMVLFLQTATANGHNMDGESYSVMPGIAYYDVDDQITMEDWMIEVDLIHNEYADQLEDWMFSEDLMEENIFNEVEDWMLKSDLIDEYSIELDQWMFNFDL